MKKGQTIVKGAGPVDLWSPFCQIVVFCQTAYLIGRSPSSRYCSSFFCLVSVLLSHRTYHVKTQLTITTKPAIFLAVCFPVFYIEHLIISIKKYTYKVEGKSTTFKFPLYTKQHKFAKKTRKIVYISKVKFFRCDHAFFVRPRLIM